MSNSQAQLIALAEAWTEAKESERAANAARIAIEEDIIAITGANEDSRETHYLPDGLKIIVVGKLTYRGDLAEIAEQTADWPDQFKIVRTKLELDEPKIRKIRAVNPSLWKRIAAYIETKPAKTGILIERSQREL
jgi:hypothetical protein